MNPLPSLFDSNPFNRLIEVRYRRPSFSLPFVSYIGRRYKVCEDSSIRSNNDSVLLWILLWCFNSEELSLVMTPMQCLWNLLHSAFTLPYQLEPSQRYWPIDSSCIEWVVDFRKTSWKLFGRVPCRSFCHHC